jgi:outer membrane protein
MRKSLAIFGLLVLSVHVFAAESGKLLTWQECVTMAGAHNPDLLSALRAQEASRANYLNSYNGILPQIGLTNSYSDSSSARTTTQADGTSASVVSKSKTWQAQGSASLNLVDFEKWAAIGSAAASWRQSQASKMLTSSNVLLALYRSFSALLYSQEETVVAKNIRDLWLTNAQMIGLRYDSGRESKGNTLRTQAERLQAEAALKQAYRDVTVAQEQLAQALGQEDFSALAVTGTWSAPQAPQSPPNFQSLVDRLPTIRAQMAAVDQAKAAVSSARSAFLPTLSLNYNRGLNDNHEFPTRDPYWTFTGNLSYPLFGGGLTSAYYSNTAANRNYEKSLQDLRSIRNQARTAVESAWSAFAQAEDQVQVQRAFLESAVQRKEESDVMYQAGLMSFQDWELVMTDYVNFQRSYLSAQQNLLSAEGQWRFATGNQLGESL